MKASKSHLEIFRLWKKLQLPSSSNIRMFQYLKTNLWIFKTSNNLFGFLITDTFSTLKSEYKNIKSDWKPKITNSESNEKLNNCLIIESGENIDSKLFCTTISSLFEPRVHSKYFDIYEIEEALEKIEEITLKVSDEFNEVIGVWGEIYLINLIIGLTKKEVGKIELLESWEGVENRTKIDFNIKSKKAKLEVKTTIQSIRIHDFNGVDQVTKTANWTGHLASFCIMPDEAGLTCFDLYLTLKNKISHTCLNILDNKIRIRGKACVNNKYKFVINPEKTLEFYDFDQIPKPKIVPGIGRISWEAILENKSSLTQIEKTSLLKLMNKIT